jgi:DNA-binding FadR family transcriptional regulator
LLKVLENIKDLLRYQQSIINGLPNVIRSSSVRHREILNAIRAGNSNLAANVMTRHITEVIEAWKKHVSPVREKKLKKRNGIYKNPIHGRLR